MGKKQRQDLDIALILLESLINDVDKTLRLTELNRVMFNLGKLDQGLSTVKNYLEKVKQQENEGGDN